MDIQLPEFYMALVIAGESNSSSTPSSSSSVTVPNGEKKIKLNPEYLQRLSLVTKDYLLKRLVAQYPTLCDFDLTIQNIEDFDRYETKLHPRFHICCEVLTIAHFSLTPTGSNGNNKPTPKPSPASLFTSVGQKFDGPKYLKFLEDIISKQTPDDACLPSVPSEVEVRLLQRPAAGGVVKAPNFYMGFESGKKLTSPPTLEEQEKMVKFVFPLAVKELKAAYPKDFQELTCFRIVKTEINERAGKPYKKYNLYVEFEAMGTFSKNPPSASDFYSTISKVLAADFLSGLDNNVGGTFANAKRMAINPCAWIDDLVEAPGGTLIGDGTIIPVHIEFWVALVVNDLNFAPTKNQMAEYDKMMEKFVSKWLARSYKDIYKGFKKFESDGAVEFQGGLPLPRFNVLRRYKADIWLDNPVPHPSHVLTTVCKCDVATLLSEIMGLNSPWHETREATMGFANFSEPAIDQTYRGKIAPKPLPKTPSPSPSSVPKKSKPPSPPTAIKPTVAPKTKSPPPAPPKKVETKTPPPVPPQETVKEKSPRPLAPKKQSKSPPPAPPKKVETKTPPPVPPQETVKERSPRPSAAKKQSKSPPPARPKSVETRTPPPVPPQETVKEGSPRPSAPKKQSKSPPPARPKSVETKTPLPVPPQETVKEKSPRQSPPKKESKSPPPAPPKKVETKTPPPVPPKETVKEKSPRQSPPKKTSPPPAPPKKVATKANPPPPSPPVQEKEKKQTEESSSSSASPPVKLEQRSADVFSAFTVKGIKVEPSKEDYEALAKANQKFYFNHLQKAFPDTFQNVQVSVRKTLFKSGKPSKQYNVYVEWNLSADFSSDKQGGGVIPDRHALCTSLVADADPMECLMKHVRTLSGTPFERAMGIYTEQVNC